MNSHKDIPTIPLTIPDTLVMHPIQHVDIHLSTLQRTTTTPHSDVLRERWIRAMKAPEKVFLVWISAVRYEHSSSLPAKPSSHTQLPSAQGTSQPDSKKRCQTTSPLWDVGSAPHFVKHWLSDKKSTLPAWHPCHNNNLYSSLYTERSERGWFRSQTTDPTTTWEMDTFTYITYYHWTKTWNQRGKKCWFLLSKC